MILHGKTELVMENQGTPMLFSYFHLFSVNQNRTLKGNLKTTSFQSEAVHILHLFFQKVKHWLLMGPVKIS